MNDMMDMQKMLRQLQELQSQVEKTQKTVESQVFIGSDPSGMVKVEIGGDRRVKAVHIQPEALDPSDPDMVQDLLVDAFNNAIGQLEQATKAQVDSLTRGMPGMPN